MLRITRVPKMIRKSKKRKHQLKVARRRKIKVVKNEMRHKKMKVNKMRRIKKMVGLREKEKANWSISR